MTVVAMPAPTRPMRQAIRESLGLFLLGRVLVQGVGLIVVALHGVPAHSRPGFFGNFYNWDSGFYYCILTSGYADPNCAGASLSGRPAFFPGYPLVARGLAWVLGGGSVAGGAIAAMWLVSFVASAIAALMIYLIASETGSVAVARGSVAVVVLGPYAVFLTASYAEAMFLALGTAAWWLTLRERWWWAGACGALAAFTRVNGVFLGCALIVLYLVSCRRSGNRPRTMPLLALSVTFLGFAGYLIILKGSVGRFTAWLDAQQQEWGRHFSLPWTTFYRQVATFYREHRFDWKSQEGLELLVAVALVFVLIAMIRSHRWAEAVYTGLTMLSLMTSTTYQSIGRNSLMIFPVYLQIGLLLERRKSRGWFAVVLVLCVVLAVFDSVQFALGKWAD